MKSRLSTLIELQTATLMVQDGVSDLLTKVLNDPGNPVWSAALKLQTGAAAVLKAAIVFQETAISEIGYQANSDGAVPTVPMSPAELAKVDGDKWLSDNKIELAIESYKHAIALKTDYIEVEHNLSIAYLNFGRYSNAEPLLSKLCKRRIGLPEKFTDNFSLEWLSADSDAPEAASAFRIQDLKEQVSYLLEIQAIHRSFAALVDRLQEVEFEIRADRERKPYQALSKKQLDRLCGYYNKLLHYEPCARISGPAINCDLDWKKIEEEYLDTHCLYFDDLMSEKCLESLRLHFMHSTIFNRFSEAGFVATYVDSGFHCGLIFQFVEELQRRLPRVMKDRYLNNMWCYRYDARGPGVRPHNGDGSVTINFYLTPDSANKAPGGGGMIMYDKTHPKEWDWLTYNMNKDDPNIQRNISEYLAGSIETKVPYKCNRAVLFRSDLFHKTDPFQFDDSFAMRRMNITMLFGKRAYESTKTL